MANRESSSSESRFGGKNHESDNVVKGWHQFTCPGEIGARSLGRSKVQIKHAGLYRNAVLDSFAVCSFDLRCKCAAAGHGTVHTHRAWVMPDLRRAEYVHARRRDAGPAKSWLTF